MINTSFARALRSSWSAETAANDKTWSSAQPCAGHCDVTALVIREEIGGDLCTTQVFRNGEFSEHHYWNRLADGTDLDLTRDQFDGTESFGEIIVMDTEFFANAGPINDELRRRLDAFRRRVDAALVDTARNDTARNDTRHA